MMPNRPREARGLAIRTFWFLLILASCGSPEPRINSLYPRSGYMGDVITIEGEYFGHKRDESYVTIGGIAPTSSAYIEWNDDHIIVRTPEFGESGLVYLYREGKRSNAALFSNRSLVPEQAEGSGLGIEPRILSLTGSPGSIGSVVTITGHNFGASREGGGVFFTWDAAPSPSVPPESRGPLFVEVFERDLGYELWSEREIRVRVPDGAVTGNLEVRTPRGASGGEFFEIKGKPGTKVYQDKRRYAISYTVDIRVREAGAANALYLWMPKPVSSASQRVVELLGRKPEPLVDTRRDASIFKFSNLQNGTSASVELAYLVEVYEVETAVQPQQIKAGGQPSPMETAFTLPSALIPSDDPAVAKQAAAIVGREQNPYAKAQRIYRWLIAEGGIQAEPLRDSGADAALNALENRRSDPYAAALLFCALARAAGVPAIPVAGVLVDGLSSGRRHYWAEFWIQGLGWVPLDPAMGAGAVVISLNRRPDGETYYFGGMDNQRIAFSRGQTIVSPMDPKGRTAVRDRDYALQNLWEEAVGDLESYSSLWGDIIVTGVYLE